MGISEETQATELPYVDEHEVVAAAGAGATWEALGAVVERSFSGGASPTVARLLGCEDPSGFHFARDDEPTELWLRGRHRFADYALMFHLEPAGEGRTRVRAETRAAFPGLKGSVYRALVIGSRGHVLVTRRMLDGVRRRAERKAAAPTAA